MPQKSLINLSNHHVLSSKDIDELRYELGQRFTPHELNIAKSNNKLDAHVYSCAVNNLGLLSFAYGDGVPIEAGICDSQCSKVISINFLTSGAGSLEQHHKAIDIAANQGLVIDMSMPFKLKLQGYSGIALIFSHNTLQQHALALIGEKSLDIDFQLEKSVDITKPAGQALKNAVVYAMNEMNGALGKLNNPITHTNLENYLLTQFIILHSNTHKSVFESANDQQVLPRNLKRACDYIHAHAHKKITLGELTAYAGCSYRSLQSIFIKVQGVSPMEYLKGVRLEGVRSVLLTADSQRTTVTEIAQQWGFVHMGRFAQMYKKQFGILPSDTLSLKK